MYKLTNATAILNESRINSEIISILEGILSFTCYMCNFLKIFQVNIEASSWNGLYFWAYFGK